MLLRGKHKCYFCEKDFSWLITIKDDTAEEIASRMSEERGIPIFTGKKKIEVDVNCPSCRNVNKLRRSLK